MQELNDIEKAVLQKLFNRRVIGAHHFRFDNLLRSGWKRDEVGEVKEAVKNLMRNGFIEWAKKSQKAVVLTEKGVEEVIKLGAEG